MELFAWKPIAMLITTRLLLAISHRLRSDGCDRLMKSVRKYSGQYLIILSGASARVIIQGMYFVLLANTLALPEFGLFAAISAAGIIIGSFSGFGFASAAFRAAATKRRLVGRYLGGLYVMFFISTPVCLACSYLLYDLAFTGRVILSTYLAIVLSEIVFWRLLEAVSQINNGLGSFSQASAGLVIGAGTRLTAAVIFKLWFRTLDDWALIYFAANGCGTVFYLYAFNPASRVCFRGIATLVFGRLRDSLMFAFSFFIFYAQSELDKLIAAIFVDGRTAGIYAISMRILDLTSVPVRGFLLLLIRESIRGGWKRSKWSAGIAIEGVLALVSLLGFIAIAAMLAVYPNIMGHQVAEASPLFTVMALVPVFKNLQEYHAELFFAWKRLELRAIMAALLTLIKALLTIIIFLSVRDLRHMGLMFNLQFATTYAVSAVILFETFYRVRTDRAVNRGDERVPQQTH